jgi:hypothetical protein
LANEVGDRKEVIVGAVIFRLEDAKFSYMQWTLKNMFFYFLMATGVKDF